MFAQIIDQLDCFGFANTTHKLLSTLSQKNESQLRNYCRKHLPRISFQRQKRFVTVKSYDKNNNEYVDNFYYRQLISHGTNNFITKWVCKNSHGNKFIPGHSYAFKECKYTTNDDFCNSFIDAFINCILFLHNKMLSHTDNFVIPFHLIAYDPKNNKIITILEHATTDLSTILQHSSISTLSKIDIFYDSIYKVASWLKIVQFDLQFVHFDLKVNNVFVNVITDGEITTKDIKLNIGDFGSSSIVFDGYNISGEQFYNVDNKLFTPTRDLYQFIHTCAIFSQPICTKRQLLQLINILGTHHHNHLNANNNIWQDIYKQAHYSQKYSPENILILFHTMMKHKYAQRTNLCYKEHCRINNKIHIKHNEKKSISRLASLLCV